jgi:asparagine synthetase B (glutamine-hydrolysing)
LILYLKFNFKNTANKNNMCGILAFFDPNGHYKGTPEELKAHIIALSARQSSRGPCGNGYEGG